MNYGSEFIEEYNKIKKQRKKVKEMIKKNLQEISLLNITKITKV